MDSIFLADYKRIELQYHLKTIVVEVNKVLKTDYNLMTFDLLKPKALILLLSDVLNNFSIIQTSNELTIDNLIMAILNGLQTVKYEPKDIAAKEFMEGITSGERKVIYPILHWILINQELIEKRVYLSHLMKKVEVPSTLINDTEFKNLDKEYSTVINEFWLAYKENKKTNKHALEAEELSNDINYIKKDIANITFRINSQKEKVDGIYKNEDLFLLAKLYQTEILQKIKLEKNLQESQQLLNSLSENRKSLRQSLDQIKMMKILKMNPISQVLKSVSINKLILATQLPKELVECKREHGISALLATSEDLALEDLETFYEKVDSLEKEVNRLGISKSCMNANTNFDMFKQQVDVLRDIKNKVSSEICACRENIVECDQKIAELSQTLHDSAGGEVFRGHKLKNFVSNLREQSILYKKIKPDLNNISKEFLVATRTLDILFLIDRSIKEEIEGMNKIEKPLVAKNVDEIKLNVKNVIKKMCLIKAQLAQLSEELKAVELAYQSTCTNYYDEKETFDCTNGLTIYEIDELKVSISLNEQLRKEQKEKCTKIIKDIKSKEKMYLLVSEEYINNFGEDGVPSGPSLKEILNSKVDVLVNDKLELDNETNKWETIAKENAEQHRILMKTLNIIITKLGAGV